MGVQEKTDLLLKQFKADSAEYSHLKTDDYSLEQKKQAIRSLMNVRMPGGLSEVLLSAQDDYLQQEREEKGVVMLAEIPTLREQFSGRVPIALRDDISVERQFVQDAGDARQALRGACGYRYPDKGVQSALRSCDPHGRADRIRRVDGCT